MGKTYRHGDRYEHATPKASKTKSLSTINVIALNRLHPGTFVLAQVPFDDDDHKFKTRPAIIRSVTGLDITIHPCYSRPRLNAIEIVRAQRTSYVTPLTVTVDQLCIVDIMDEQVPDDVLSTLGVL